LGRFPLFCVYIWHTQKLKDASMNDWRKISVTLVCALWIGYASAQIKIGQTAGFTGAVAGGVKEASQGAKLYIDAVNARGGVAGQLVELIQLDDQFDPKLAAENARILIDEKKVTALFLTRGTPHTEAILPLLEQKKVVLIAPSTGAMSLHAPVLKYVFNVRSSYQREAEYAVQHLQTVGVQRIGIIYRDDTFGEDGLTGVLKGLQAQKLTAAMQEKYDRKTPDFAKAVAAAVRSNVQTIIFVGGGNEVVNGVRALRAAGSLAQIVSLSNNASAGFAKSLEKQGSGVIVMQVFPSERNTKYAVVRELIELSGKADIKDISPATIEGFVAAKVLVEALRRASPAPSREKIHAALQSMQRYDVGGLDVSFSPTDHTGLNFVDISILTADGKFRR
jgi:ABC-type branched-subunit amino acid transport system substrate-binding protein